jgi:hypothetical protein
VILNDKFLTRKSSGGHQAKRRKEIVILNHKKGCVSALPSSFCAIAATLPVSRNIVLQPEDSCTEKECYGNIKIQQKARDRYTRGIRHRYKGTGQEILCPNVSA